MRWLMILLAVGFIGMAVPARAQDWQPDRKVVAKLASTKRFKDFSIRPPTGLVLEQKSQSGDGHVMLGYYWRKPHGKSIVGNMMVTIFDTPLPVSPEQAVNDWVEKTVSVNITVVTQSTIESGTIHDVAFARAYYKGPLKATGATAHGFVYIGITDSHTYIIEAIDTEPANAKSLPLAEASTLTFREHTTKTLPPLGPASPQDAPTAVPSATPMPVL